MRTAGTGSVDIFASRVSGMVVSSFGTCSGATIWQGQDADGTFIYPVRTPAFIRCCCAQ
jgi:hypothetical protein